MKKYDPKSLEPKWQQVWSDTNVYAAKDNDPRQKYYFLMEFPYPSGDGLHVGHVLGFTALDIMARHKRMQDLNVLYPIGFDEFGLPTENYAIKHKIAPQLATDRNVANFRKQFKSLGLSFDWDREVRTADPNYYKWTQWIFLKLYEKGLAYQAELAINWCPFEKTGLANEEVVDGKHERCGTPVEKKLLNQWVLKITEYADRLADDLKTVNYLDRIATQQINWIGRSEGAEITWQLEGLKTHGKFDRVIVLHGKNAAPEDKWYPWFKQQVEAAGLKCEVPELGRDDVPKLADWLKKLDALKPDERTILVGHSRGGMAIMRWLEQAPMSTKIGRAILVAANDGAHPDKAGGDFFYGEEYDYAKAKRHCDDFVVVHSRDDYQIPFAAGEKHAAKLSVTLSAFEDKGHFARDTREVPEVLALTLNESKPSVTVYTTRPDTLFGATFLVVSPEVASTWLKSGWKASSEAAAYIDAALKASELSRQEESKVKTGVDTGVKAVHPLTGVLVPVWVADYVLGSYGTGAIMAVPAHDERDNAFAKAMNAQSREFGAHLDGAVEVEGAVVIGYDPHTKKFLSIKDGATWLVGGGRKDNETYEAAARRELAEETGYHDPQSFVQLGGPVNSYYFNDKKQSNRRSHAYNFLAILDSQKSGKTALEDHEKFTVEWLDYDDLVAAVKQTGGGVDHWLYALALAKQSVERYERGHLSGELLPIVNVLNPVLVREDAKSHTNFKQHSKIVAIVENDKSEILTINWGPKFGGRLTIGGTVEGNESAETTARREVAEETGYHDLDLVEVGAETMSYKYFAFSKNEAHDTQVQFVQFKLASDARKPDKLDDSEKNKFTVEWVSRAVAEREIVEPLHKYAYDKFINGKLFTGYAPLVNSGEFNGLEGTPAKHAIVKALFDKGAGKAATKYKLRDWIFSRQHYWGEPIPIVHCPKDGLVPVPADQLPVTLPVVESYEPTETGESPLAAITDWVNTTCPQCGGPATRETDTMPNWAGSSWYWLRYTDAHNDKAFASEENLKYWTPVDHYNGGMEHTTLHLLYSRFWHKVLYDLGLVPSLEPYAKRTSHGMILGPDGQKMSKSKGNVINPDHVIEKYGADTIRLYEMFMGPFDEVKAWSEDHLNGVSRFIYRVWTWLDEMMPAEPDVESRTLASSTGYVNDIGAFTVETDRIVHKTLKKVHHDIEEMRFNTAVSALMELINYLAVSKHKELLWQDNAIELKHRTVRTLVLMLAPFVPHLTEEVWHENLGEEGSVHVAAWPKYDPQLIKDDVVTMVVQINGKVRANIAVPTDASEPEVTQAARADENVARHLKDQVIVKTIVVPRKIVNFVVKG